MVVAVRERALACEFLSRASVVALHAVDVGSRAREGCVCVCVCVCQRSADGVSCWRAGQENHRAHAGAADSAEARKLD